MRSRERPLHPIAQRCIDSSKVKYLSHLSTEHPQYIYKLAEPDKMEGFVDRMCRWSDAMGVTPQEFLAQVSKYITETRQISTQQSKTAI